MKLFGLPKSANLSSPISLMSKFWGLTSRCSIRRRWQYHKPRKSWNMNNLTLRGLMPPGCLSKYWDKSVCWKRTIYFLGRIFFHAIWKLTTYSKTKVNEFRVWMMSCRVTMLLCLSSFNSEASRMAVKGVPSSSCSRISFKATTCWVKLKVRQF